ncbi:MAG: sodium:solute symporter family transporter [Planctomycetota bacterium]|jgi:SSS family transporter
MLGEFGTTNTAILLVYLGGMVSIGLLLAGRQKTTEDYFLAGRNMPWLAVGMSMFASLTSATTYMGVPAFAYSNNIAMIFGVAMSLVAAPILGRFFYPVYRKRRVTTSYEYILARYGQAARRAVSALFVLSRLGWLGIVIYAPAKAMSVASGMPLTLAITLMGLLAVVYTVLGGLSAVIWTDVVQFVILFGGAVWLVGTLVVHVPGGAGEIVRVAAGGGKFDVFDWTDFGKLTALSAMIGWFFVFLNEYGTDQVTAQRLLAVRTDKGVVKAIAFNAVNDVLINGMLIFIGIGMFAYFQAFPEKLKAGVEADGMLPFYIMHVLPAGVSGLLVTAIFAAAMSSVDSGINSLSTVIVNDWIKPWRRGAHADRGDVALARWLTVTLGVLATVAALYAARIGGIVEMWMRVMGLFAAPTLSVFVLGMFTRRAHFLGWLVGACSGVALTVILQICCKDQLMAIWHFPISFLLTTSVGYAVSALTRSFQRSRS